MPPYSPSYLLVCDPDQDQTVAAFEFLQQLYPERYHSPTNPQLQWLNQDQDGIKIEVVRQLIQELSYASYGSHRLIVLLHFESAQAAAQNALLKTLEEPPRDTQLLLVTDQLGSILPTVMSRCLVVHSQARQIQPAENDLDFATLFSQISSATPATCIELAEKYSDRAEAQNMIRHLIHYLTTQLHQQATPQLVSQLSLLLETNRQLSSNVNAKLAMENCFFAVSGQKQ